MLEIQQKLMGMQNRMMSQMGLGGAGGMGGMGGLGGLDPSALKGMDMNQLKDLAKRFK